MTPEAAFADFSQLLALRERFRQPGAMEALAETRPRLAPALELRARHVVAKGEFVPAEFVFSLESRFGGALRLEGFLIPMVARLNGGQSLRSVFDDVSRAGELPSGFSLSNFLRLAYNMLELGMLVPEVTTPSGD
jgi:hypothetical protein